jgi:isopenicillin N synthase-like dioxygenase
MNDLPIIDCAPLLTGDRAVRRRVVTEIGRSCRDIGFFYISRHGVGDAIVTDLFTAARQFFALPLVEKERVSITNALSNYGYVALGGENLDPARPGDAKEAFNVGRDLAPDDPDVLAGKPFHAVNQWPDLDGFRPVLMSYFGAMRRLCERLHRAFACDLGVAADFFEPYIDAPLATLRLLHYPPHPVTRDDRLYGAAPHTDYGNLTILAQDDRGGLQVRRRDGTWIDAVPIAGTFVCNIGDCLMRWSNDTYVSTPHRVVNRSGRDRYSVAFFFDPNADAPIECLPGCVTAERPARYPPTTGAAYLKERLDATYSYRRERGSRSPSPGSDALFHSSS